ncbi:MarR family winged helix-turn-helix transcriptional regulator [Symbioplanes lichenis]|uniref:MarR family winged helix-turn-helix transcriptional regulator n=1 Tax=Symbioplanes lichenis TaxID=1629072 RepID=UPI002739FF82|nr:MarR family transcriptional regulator [Actinoplanes lichenis]
MDLLDSNHWSDVHRLLADLDRDIAGLYTEAGIHGIRTRFVGPLIAIGRFGPLTIRELADRRNVSHSAMSQTVTAMRQAGLVETEPGPDARTRLVQLTARARDAVPFMEAEWRATEATTRQLDEELPYSLTQVVADIRAALERKSFVARLQDNFA